MGQGGRGSGRGPLPGCLAAWESALLYVLCLSFGAQNV